MFSNKHKQAFFAIKKAKNILLVTHNRPDGDALSSIGAMAELLTQMDKKFFAYCLDLPPHQFNFLPHIEKISNKRSEFNFKDYDLIIALDCGSLSRTNLAKEIKEREHTQLFIEFDHHPKVDDYTDIEIRDPESSSTTDVLYWFFKSNKLKINKNIANCILTGILTDTANFLYPSATATTIKIASKMLLHGARFSKIMKNTWRNKSLSALKLWGIAMNRLEINKKYNFAFSLLTREEIEKSNANEEELEGIAGFLSNLHGVNGLVFLREEKGIIKGSLRTAHPKINVSKLARELGGGGHAKASGFTIKGSLLQTDKGWRII